ncbi:MAG: hypothetical protein JJU36_11350 [Phycisphaeraceae bacterium]|nr:hypothetical protein [Phycisphaeraceae bacterium]
MTNRRLLLLLGMLGIAVCGGCDGNYDRVIAMVERGEVMVPVTRIELEHTASTALAAVITRQDMIDEFVAFLCNADHPSPRGQLVRRPYVARLTFTDGRSSELNFYVHLDRPLVTLSVPYSGFHTFPWDIDFDPDDQSLDFRSMVEFLRLSEPDQIGRPLMFK